jgi:hypothetical protein
VLQVQGAAVVSARCCWLCARACVHRDALTGMCCVQGPYFGGEHACRAADDSFDPAELLCAGCAPHSADAVCVKHGTDYVEFKCRFCCSIAVRVSVCVPCSAWCLLSCLLSLVSCVFVCLV